MLFVVVVVVVVINVELYLKMIRMVDHYALRLMSKYYRWILFTLAESNNADPFRPREENET
jgi:hypothetical protein